MMQIFGSLAIILPVLLAVALAGSMAFWRAMDAHAEFYRYEHNYTVDAADDDELHLL